MSRIIMTEMIFKLDQGDWKQISSVEKKVTLKEYEKLIENEPIFRHLGDYKSSWKYDVTPVGYRMVERVSSRAKTKVVRKFDFK